VVSIAFTPTGNRNFWPCGLQVERSLERCNRNSMGFDDSIFPFKRTSTALPSGGRSSLSWSG
jgi:hypothetical protein